MIKRFSVAILIFICLFLTSCTKSKAVAETAATPLGQTLDAALDPNEEVTLYFVGSYDNFEALEKLASDFKAIYPNFNLVYEKLDDYYNTGLANRLASNQDVDLFMELYSTTADKGHALDLSKVGLDFESLIESPIKASYDNGAIRALPMAMQLYGMMVNEDLLSREGIAIPSTFTELCAACDALIEKGYEYPIRGFNNTFFYDMMIGDITVGISKKDNAQEIFDNIASMGEGYEEYLLPYYEIAHLMAERSYISLEANSEISDDYEATLLRFMEGDIPFMVTSGATVSGSAKREKKSESYKANPFSYSFMPIPLSDAPRAYASVFVTFSINASSANLEWAKAFVRFATTAKELDAFASVKRVFSISRLSEAPMFRHFTSMDSSNMLITGEYEIRRKFLSSFAYSCREMLSQDLSFDQALEVYVECMHM